MGLSVVDAPSFRFLNRISDRPEWNGLEGRRYGGDQLDTFHGYQVGSMVTRREELSDSSGFEGRDSDQL